MKLAITVGVLLVAACGDDKGYDVRTATAEECPNGGVTVLTAASEAFPVCSGKDGAPGVDGAPGIDGAPGADGAAGPVTVTDAGAITVLRAERCVCTLTVPPISTTLTGEVLHLSNDLVFGSLEEAQVPHNGSQTVSRATTLLGDSFEMRILGQVNLVFFLTYQRDGDIRMGLEAAPGTGVEPISLGPGDAGFSCSPLSGALPPIPVPDQ
jgi:hypothetical protein